VPAQRVPHVHESMRTFNVGQHWLRIKCTEAFLFMGLGIHRAGNSVEATSEGCSHEFRSCLCDVDGSHHQSIPIDEERQQQQKQVNGMPCLVALRGEILRLEFLSVNSSYPSR
jgi:hypothetical protein